MIQKLQRAILVNIIPPEIRREEAMAEFDELVRLVETYGGIVILKILQKRGRPSAKTFLGEGKAREVALLVQNLKADVVVINGFLKANQCNNLINIIPCEVLDRFEMILKIFQKHAHTPEAKLQLQIAYYKYEFPKLFGRGAVLSQQAAGVGAKAVASASGGRRAARGPGEKVLEVKRRHLRGHIKGLERKLEQFRKVKGLQRERRRREAFKTAALIGYTNSGKSSLLKALTKKEHIVIEDKLFSTLDTRLGEMYAGACAHGEGQKIVIADTIGFMQNLPPLLFTSFLATLEEVKHADLLLHVIDISDAKIVDKINVVEDILLRLGCGETPRMYVFNKTDLLPTDTADEVMHTLHFEFQNYSPQFVSALTGRNLKALREDIAQLLSNTSMLVLPRCSHSSTDRTQASGA